MTFTVSDTLGKLIELKLRNGKFLSVEELLTESLLRLDDSDVPYFGEFDAGELERLIDEGLNSGTPVSADDVFATMGAKRASLAAAQALNPGRPINTACSLNHASQW